MKPLPTWEEVTRAVTIEDGMIRADDLRAAFGPSRCARMSDNKWGGKVSAEIVRARCDLDNTTETLGVAAKRVGLTRWALHNGLKRHGIIHKHGGHKGARWNRIPKGVADKIAAMRGAR